MDILQRWNSLLILFSFYPHYLSEKWSRRMCILSMQREWETPYI